MNMRSSKIVAKDAIITDPSGGLWVSDTTNGDTIPIKGSDLYGHWVQWPGSGGPWPIGPYLGYSGTNGRRMWATISPLSHAGHKTSGKVLRTHIPDGAMVVQGPYALHAEYFATITEADLDIAGGAS